MKQMKLWGMMMVMMMMAPLMVACGGDDSDDGSRGNELVTKAIGTWMCTSSTDSARGMSYDGLMVGKQVNPGIRSSVALSFRIVDRIHDILTEKGLKQKDLAVRLGKSEAEISKWMHISRH